MRDAAFMRCGEVQFSCDLAEFARYFSAIICLLWRSPCQQSRGSNLRQVKTDRVAPGLVGRSNACAETIDADRPGG